MFSRGSIRWVSTKAAESVSFPGGRNLPICTKPVVIDPKNKECIPCYRVMDEEGVLLKGAMLPHVDQKMAKDMYRYMIRLNTMDNILLDAQRQGRICFYAACSGEEAIHFGSAAAIKDDDLILAQYREAGVLMWRGFTVEEFADQCYSNAADYGLGRQMPVHYGSKALHYQTISSCLTTQMPQASGAAYAYKLSGEEKIVICYFGEGAASEGDFHAALNFAATRECPVLFFCRNNGYAISTPAEEQFRGDGIASRALGYGIPTMRVDGNDIWAVYEATRVARDFIRKENRPMLLEAMTYRQGHHSTSDDSTLYRDVAEIEAWKERFNPITRLKLFMIKKNWWDDQQDTVLRQEERLHVLDGLKKAEAKGKPSLRTLFEDIYSDKPQHLQEQEQQMLSHIAKYPQQYPLPQ